MAGKQIIAESFNRNEPIFRMAIQEENDKKIEKAIKSTHDMRMATSLIPFFSSDELREKYMREYSEYITDTNERKTKAYSISSIVSEPIKIKEMRKAYNGKVGECGEELATVIASFESMRLKLKLMEMLLHRRNQGIVMASLPKCEETNRAIEQWIKDNYYTEETATREIEQGRAKLYNVARKESEYSSLDYATRLDMLSDKNIPRDTKYEIIDTLTRPNVYGKKDTLKAISDIEPEEFDLLHEMMVQTGKPLKECLKITCEYNDGKIAEKEKILEKDKELVAETNKGKADFVPETPVE